MSKVIDPGPPYRSFASTTTLSQVTLLHAKASVEGMEMMRPTGLLYLHSLLPTWKLCEESGIPKKT